MQYYLNYTSRKPYNPANVPTMTKNPNSIRG